MLPKNLPLLMISANPQQAKVLEKVAQCSMSPAECLVALGRHWRIRVKFSQPVDIRTKLTKVKQPNGSYLWRQHIHTDNHVFSNFFMSSTHGLCYATGRRRGYPFPITCMSSYEPLPNTADVFRDYEHFKAKFDMRFITEAEIQKLWSNSSAQTGEQYKPSDFHGLGPRGKQVLKEFLYTFVDVNTTGDLTRHHYTNRHPGRDITISHRAGVSYVHYSSEYSGCGNGRYGLIANCREFLHLEDD